jgi:hypothetical protein
LNQNLRGPLLALKNQLMSRAFYESINCYSKSDFF